MELSMKEKHALSNVTGPRYRKANKAGTGRIWDEFCQSAGYRRKYAIALLRHAGKTQLRRIGKQAVNLKTSSGTRKKRACKRFSDGPVEKAVLAIWDFFRFVCGTRLVPMIRGNLDALAGHPRFRHAITGEVKAKLATASRSTVERMLGRERKRNKPKGTASTNSRLL
jgi:hypothetical protein